MERLPYEPEFTDEPTDVTQRVDRKSSGQTRQPVAPTEESPDVKRDYAVPTEKELEAEGWF